MKKHRRKRGGLLPLSKIKPPAGGPAKLYHIVLLARLRDAVGMPAGASLIDYRLSDQALTLVFDDKALCRALAAGNHALEAKLGEIVGRPEVAVRWEAVEHSTGYRKPMPSTRAPIAPEPSGRSPAERIRAVAERIRETRASGGGSGNGRIVDSDAKRP